MKLRLLTGKPKGACTVRPAGVLAMYIHNNVLNITEVGPADEHNCYCANVKIAAEEMVLLKLKFPDYNTLFEVLKYYD